MKPHLLSGFVLALLMSMTTVGNALAQTADGGGAKSGPREHGSGGARFEGNRLAFELDVWPTERLKTFTYGLVGQLRISRAAHFDFEVPVATLFPEEGDSELLFGNPSLGLHWAGAVGPSASLAFGAEVAIPTLVTSGETTLESLEDILPRIVAAESRAQVDAHRFLPDFLVLRPFLAAELRLNDTVRYRGDLTPSTFVPVGELARETSVILEHGSELEALSQGGVGGGFRVQAAFLVTGEDSADKAQAALEPFFAYQKEKGFFTRLGLLVALDGPLGLGLDEGKLATLRLTLGSAW